MSNEPVELKPGDKAPAFKLNTTGGEVALKDFKGRKVLLYFYPKDMTPTCTEQACQFRDRMAEFRELGVDVLGVSPDEVERHGRFAEKYTLPFPLLSDPSHKVAEKYGVWRLKKLYGREYMGIVRSTFLINEKGKILRVWRNVRIKGHLDQVLAELRR
jgi:peroxiredoxin Q/BCP